MGFVEFFLGFLYIIYIIYDIYTYIYKYISYKGIYLLPLRYRRSIYNVLEVKRYIYIEKNKFLVENKEKIWIFRKNKNSAKLG